MNLNARIVATARSWIGTRFHHQGRLKYNGQHKGGVDCLGLLIGVARELNLRLPDGRPLTYFDETSYSHYPDPEHLQFTLEKFFPIVAQANLAAGNIILLHIDDNPQHLAIVGSRAGDHSLIHAYAPARAVVEHPLDDWWQQRIVSIYQIGRTTYQFDLPVKYIQIEPGDIVTVSLSNSSHYLRITSTRVHTPGIIRLTAIAEDISTYDFYTSPGNTSELLQQNLNTPLTRLELLDMPAFPGDDVDKGVLRMAGAGLSAGWIGAAVYRSDDGANYSRIADLATPAVMGTATNVLGAGNTTVFDEENSVTVLLLGESELQSVTELAVLNGANAALLGNELMQFRSAELIEPGKYTLTGLLRGRLGTEWAVTSHSAGERFVLLDSRIGRQMISSNMVGLERQYKPVTFNSTISATTAQDFSYTGIALKPYAPVHVSGVRDGSDNLTLSWTRRTRLGGNWQDAVDVPLNETSEAYEVDIMDGSNVIRTLMASSPTVDYSATDQTTDFGSPQSAVTVKIYQVSGIIGRGYAAEATV